MRWTLPKCGGASIAPLEDTEVGLIGLELLTKEIVEVVDALDAHRLCCGSSRGEQLLVDSRGGAYLGHNGTWYVLLRYRGLHILKAYLES